MKIFYLKYIKDYIINVIIIVIMEVKLENMYFGTMYLSAYKHITLLVIKMPLLDIISINDCLSSRRKNNVSVLFAPTSLCYHTILFNTI